MDSIRLALRLIRLGAKVFFWMLETLWLGARASRDAAWYLRRLPVALRRTQRCPRGHVTETVGVFTCQCGASFEGWAYAACPVCRQTCGWIPCPVCTLPVQNPLLR